MGISVPARELSAQVFRGPPAAVTKPVATLCDRISPGQTPLYVSFAQQGGTKPHMCFENVRTIAAKLGGHAEYGWLIWEWKDNYLEAEHHAVWNRDGKLVDVTPQSPSRARVLFLPEPGRCFDFEGRRRIDNLRVPLRNDAKVREYLHLSARCIEIEELNSSGGDVVLSADAHFERDRIRYRLRTIERGMALWSLNRMGRNDSCWCGSGRKFKSCCRAEDGRPATPHAAVRATP